MSKSNAWGGALAASENTKKLSVVDQEAEKRVEEQRAKKGHLRLSRIKDRSQSTRDLNPKHVDGLVTSIAELGMIQAIAVDQDGVLLAGGHRLAAVRKLKDEHPKAFDKWFADEMVPVTTMPLGDTEDERERRALAIEVSENEKRRDYTNGEVQQLADRLRAAGYREGSGRLKPGEKSLAPALAVVMGKSLRTARRLLAASALKAEPKDSQEFVALRRCERAIRAYLDVVGNAPGQGALGTCFQALRAAQTSLSEAMLIRGQHD